MSQSSTAKALFALSRPEGALFVVLLPVLGYWFAIWDHGQLVAPTTWAPLHLLLFVVWSLIHAGTVWLNAALDRDTDDVLWARAVSVPEHIDRWAMAALLVATSLALAVHRPFGAIATICALLALLYSHPRTAWKGHALFGPATNIFGYGLLAPLSGWLLAGLPMTARGVVTFALFVPIIAAAYFAAQAFQARQDRDRGYHTLVATHGSATVLRLVRILLLATAAAVLLLSVIGWYPRALLTLALPLAGLDLLVRRWADQPAGGDARWARRFVFGLLFTITWGMVVVCGVFEWQERAGEPRGGLGTARGQPETSP